MPDTATLEEVSQEVAALRDLFHRRLLEDKAKNRLYDELYSQIVFVRADLVRTYLRPLLNELFRIIDRLTVVGDDAVAITVVEELTEILSRRGVRSLPPSDSFDPHYHEAVRAEPSDTIPKGGITELLRPGYLLDNTVLRPALVVVSTGPEISSPQEVDTSTELAVENGQVPPEPSDEVDR